MKNTYYLALDDIERAVVIRSLNNLRNRLKNQNKYTDGVDDVLIKIIGARKKNFKILYAEE
ncbi:MAG: hypothetical protein ACLSAO_07325 [Anaerovoracaceae bacterium]